MQRRHNQDGENQICMSPESPNSQLGQTGTGGADRRQTDIYAEASSVEGLVSFQPERSQSCYPPSETFSTLCRDHPHTRPSEHQSPFPPHDEYCYTSAKGGIAGDKPKADGDEEIHVHGSLELVKGNKRSVDYVPSW